MASIDGMADRAGSGFVTLEGRGDDGRPLEAGVYFYRLRLGEVVRRTADRGGKVFGISLKDRSAIEGVPVGGEEWLIGEILSFRGEAVVLQPTELRSRIAERARTLLSELGLSRVRVPSAS